MNRVHTTLAIALLAATAIGWQLWPPTPPKADRPFLYTVAAAPTPDPVPGGSGSGLPTLPTIEPAPPAATEVPRDATAQVLEQNGCIVTGQQFDPESAELNDVYTCPPAEDGLSDGHPYESWNDETLAGMAYGDARAAEVLGLRHVTSEDPGEEAMGLSLLYRSAALSGDPDVFHKAIGRRYAYLSVNGEAQLHNLRQLLVFSLIGRKLGGEGFDPAPIESRLMQADVSRQEITQLRSVAGRILRSMSELQREVTGNTSIEEAIADA